jgi:hypothetical protein
MKVALIILGLAAAYLIAQLYMLWRSRNDNLPEPPPGGWKEPEDWDDAEDDWPQPPKG